MTTSTDTVTANAVFEIDGWILNSAGGTDVAPEVAANETLLKTKLIEYFQDTFLTTFPPEVSDITVDGDDYDSWLSAYEYDQENEEENG